MRRLFLTVSFITIACLTAQNASLAQAPAAPAPSPNGLSPIDKSNPSKSGQDTNLRGHPVPPIAPAADKLPIDKIKLPPGFKAEVWSSGHPGARTMVQGNKGTLFMGSRVIGRVYAITEKDGKREVKILLQGLTQPNGLAFRDGALYVFAINKVYRYDNIEDKLDNPGTPVELTAAYNLPSEIHHNWKYVDFGPDGKMYVQVGSNCNICELNPGIYGQIRRYNADGTGMEIVARINGGKATIEPFMTGLLDEKTNAFYGRPSYVFQMKDGSLLVSDETSGATYRITYSPQRISQAK